MISFKIDLLNDPVQAAELIERLAENVRAVRAMSKVSPKLSAANNSALMLATTLHKTLSQSGERGWYKKFQALVQDMCKRCDLTRCDLTAATIQRYQRVGELMLRCNVVACLLPSFVAVAEDAIEALLNEEQTAKRLDDAFKRRLTTFFAEMGESYVLQQLVSKPVLELAGSSAASADGCDNVSPLEQQVNSLLEVGN